MERKIKEKKRHRLEQLQLQKIKERTKGTKNKRTTIRTNKIIKNKTKRRII